MISWWYSSSSHFESALQVERKGFISAVLFLFFFRFWVGWIDAIPSGRHPFTIYCAVYMQHSLTTSSLFNHCLFIYFLADYLWNVWRYYCEGKRTPSFIWKLRTARLFPIRRGLIAVYTEFVNLPRNKSHFKKLVTSVELQFALAEP